MRKRSGTKKYQQIMRSAMMRKKTEEIVSGGERITDQELSTLLGLYPENRRFVAEATYSHLFLTAALKSFPYDYTKEDLDYVTATQISLYLSQLTYVLVGAAVARKDHPAFPDGFISIFLERMHTGHLYFLRVNQRMHKPIKKSGSILAEMEIKSLRHWQGLLIGHIAFVLDNGCCSGTVVAGVQL